MLSSSAQVYHKVQIAADQEGKWIIKLLQKYEYVYNGFMIR